MGFGCASCGDSVGFGSDSRTRKSSPWAEESIPSAAAVWTPLEGASPAALAAAAALLLLLPSGAASAGDGGASAGVPAWGPDAGRVPNSSSSSCAPVWRHGMSSVAMGKEELVVAVSQ